MNIIRTLQSTLLLTLSLAVAIPARAADSIPDDARNLVLDVARLADARNFTALASLFASHVVLDYGYPDVLTPAQIVATWQPLLSGFDRTEHKLSDIDVHSKDGRLLGGARFVADHFIGNETWTLRGRYEYEFTTEDGALRIMRMRMIPETTAGNSALLEEAKRRGGVTAPQRRHAVEHVTFRSGGDTLRGWLFLPEKPVANEVIVAAGSWTTVKEMMSRLYAKELAEHGYTTLIFDFRGYGESEGEPRFYESPQRKTEDFGAAVDFIARSERFRKARITILGVCASAGYAAGAAAANGHVARLALVAPWLHDPRIAKETYDRREIGSGTAGGYATLIAEGAAAFARHREQGVVQYVAGASATDPRAAMYVPNPASPWDYYYNRDRGLLPQWGNRFAVLSWPEWLAYDSLVSAPNVKVPTVIVHSERGAIPAGTRAFIERMRVGPQVHWIDGIQLDFYDHTDKITEATALVMNFIGRK